jgi:hypothetical protein
LVIMKPSLWKFRPMEGPIVERPAEMEKWGGEVSYSPAIFGAAT